MARLVDTLSPVFVAWGLPAAWMPYATAAIALLVAFLVAALAAVYGGVFIFFERRIAARIMSRIGPNRVGPQGLLQFIADAVKLIIKEDIIPTAADRPLFKLAPYLMYLGVVAGFAVLPISHRIIGADLNVGILYVLAITSITVVGVLMSGWASNSKWALFGGMRAAAQLVSYEIPSGLAVLPPVLLAGTMSTQGIIAAQTGSPDAWYTAGGWFWNWNIFHSPMLMTCFVVFFIAQLAEGARIPFDLPEGESELVSGYNTEYSGFRFGAYFTAEFANTFIAGALAVIVFLGGWQIPGVVAPTPEAVAAGNAVWLTPVFGELADARWWWLMELLTLLVFAAKMAAVIFLIIQLRWTIPRVRIDQMMSICWKYLLPITFACIFLTLGWMIVLPWESAAGLGVRAGMVLFGLALILLYARRVRYAIDNANEQAYPHWII
jgi:NADH-quinone oxidoreductase subunit H